MPVGTAVAAQAGKEQAQTVEQFRGSAEGTAHPGNAGPLMQGQRRGHVADFLNFCLGRLADAPAGIGGKRFQIAARSFGVQRAQSQRGFA